MKNFIVSTFLLTIIVACAANRKVTPFAIGVVKLHNYQLNTNTSFDNEIDYAFITNPGTFDKMFSLTKASVGTAIVPNFNSQSVVAIILKPTTKVVSVDIDKAEISGENLNVYYTITDTTQWKTYPQIPMVAATVPRSGSIKRVNFYSKGLKEKTITVSGE